MRNTISGARRRFAHPTALISVIATCALVLAACGSAPAESTDDTGTSQSSVTDTTTSDEGGAATETSSSESTGGETGGETGSQTTSQGTSSSPTVISDFGAACMVTDTGGIQDRSFNEASWKGVENASSDLGIDKQLLQSTAEADYVPNITQLVNGDCGIIVTVGALMADATKEAATKYPDQKFAIVDVTYPETMPNVRGLAFDTSQSAFLAGYLAAGMTKTGTVAEYGGMAIPPVELYMDGFAKGVAYYNDEKDATVKVLGWDPSDPSKGLYANSFTDTVKGRQITQQLMNQGADIIFPLAGNVNNGTVSAVKQAGNAASVIWVDTDGCVSVPDACGMFITSAEKHIAVAVEDAISNAATGQFEAGNYVGTLANDGVGLAPYHQFADKVPADLQSEIDQLKQQIIDGDVTIESEFKPQTG